jgi:hypothetical protein
MNIQESKEQKRFLKNLNKREHIDISDTTRRLFIFLSGLPQKQKEKFIDLLKQVQKIQLKSSNTFQKSRLIKNILWTEQSVVTKLITGKFLAVIAGNFTFGTGRIEEIGLGSAYDVWGFLADKSGKRLLDNTIRLIEKT